MIAYDIDVMAERIETFLRKSPQTCAMVTTPCALERRVKVYPASWLRWLDEQPPPGTAARRAAPQPTASPVVREHLRIAREFVEGLSVEAGVGSIDRQHLVDLATAVDRSTTDEEMAAGLLRLWVAMMMWGSGTTNGRGPWRTRQSLESEQLVHVLRSTAICARAGNLPGAHDTFKIAGVGESFFTKWFWAATLSRPPAERALILDQRVRKSWWKLQPADRYAPRGGAGYAGFVGAVHRIADRLETSEFGHFDAEKIEWLLFDRAPQDRVDLHEWLVAQEPLNA